MKVLIIEDNQILAKNISKYLELEKIESHIENTSKLGLYEAITSDYDCIILDLNLDEIDGLEICKKIRDKAINTPIIILTARDKLEDKIKGLNYGADDYVTKPFEYEELLARIKSSVRRTFTQKSQILSIGNIDIDLDKKILKKAGEKIELTNLEYNVLEYMLHNKGKVISKEELLEKIWGDLEANMQTRTVDMYISHLRKKLGKDIIETKKGLGYIIN